MQKGDVNIVLSDRGWILEKLAKEISTRHDYVTFDTQPNRNSRIQYYITYGCRSERISPIEVALFTHQEEIPSAKERFLQIAREIDVPISMSNATGRILNSVGIDNLVISPGVDLQRFAPRIKIGVVGRTYHTGRKGEALVAAVQDIPDIEWHFTGDGWPGPAKHVSDDHLPEFYRSMDYILVPATIEGGPMSVLEALASGVPVIGSDVGWVSEFPHLAFERGNPASLRAVLLDIRAERFKLREAVESQTWQKWADQHDELFRNLLAEASFQAPNAHVAPRTVRRATLVLHGVENSALGGPSVRVPETARTLAAEGIKASVQWSNAPKLDGTDIVHCFNIWTPPTATAIARRAKRLQTPFVFSPILLDLRDRNSWALDIPAIFRRARSPREADALLASLGEQYRWRAENGSLPDPSPDYGSRLREIAELSDAFIFLSEHERALCAAYGAMPPVSGIVRNPVDADKFSSGDPETFKREIGVDNYALVIGRIEPRKNQLLLAHALKGTDIPLVIVGHSVDPDYERLIREVADDNVIFLGRLEPSSPQLLSALAGARVFTLPSFCEGAPLAALEAAAAGSNMVLSNRSSEGEYFGDFARYCDPIDPHSIRTAILEAWDNPLSPEKRQALIDHVRAEFSWERYAKDTASVYEAAAEHYRHVGPSIHPAAGASAAAEQAANEVVFDVTTNAAHGALKSGITRVERSLAQALTRSGVNVRFVAWSSRGHFQEVPRDVVDTGTIKYFLDMHSEDLLPDTFTPGTPFVVTGSGWMQNGSYAEGLSQFAGSHKLKLCVLIHDLTPTLFPYWYQKGYSANFNRNFTTLMRSADHFLVYSDNTRADLEKFAIESDIDIAAISKFRLADELDVISESQRAESARLRDVSNAYSGKKFVLSVGAIHARKNYDLLKDVWVKLVEELGDECPHLIIVGGVSWNGEDTSRALSEDRRIARFVHVLSNIDDPSLDWLYSNCTMTAYPSLYEGWGLPIGESLNYGKVCISSNTSSMVEIAPGLTDLLDPQDRQAWASKISFYARSRSARDSREQEIKSSFSTTTWADSAASLLRALPVTYKRTERFLYNVGTGVSLGDQRSAVLYKSGGWHSAEKWGSWSAERRSSVRLEICGDSLEEDFIFAAVLTSAIKKSGLRCWVTANGTRIAEWHLQGNGLTLRSAVLPKRLIGTNRLVDIEFGFDAVMSAREINPQSNDMRNLGLGIAKFILLRPKAPLDLAKWLVHEQPQNGVLPFGRWLTYHSPLFKLAAASAVTQEASSARPVQGVLALRIPAEPTRSGVRVTAILRGAQTSERALAISAAVNGVRLQKFLLEEKGEASSIIFDIPPNMFRTGRPVELQFAQDTSEKQGKFGLIGIRLDNIEERSALGPTFLPMDMSASSADPVWGETWRQLLTTGWYEAEEIGQWSIAGEGMIEFRLPSDFADHLLIIRASRFPTDDPSQVDLRTGGSTIGSMRFPQAGQSATDALIDLNELATQGPDVSIRFEGLPSVSADQLGVSKDNRLLGICLHNISTVLMPPLQVGVKYDIDDRPTNLFYFEGWHGPEEVGRWTAQERAVLKFRTPRDLDPDGVIKLRLSILASADQNTTVKVALGGSVIAVGEAALSGPYELIIPASEFVPLENRLVDMELMTDRIIIPSQAGFGSDDRRLGVMIHSLEFSEPSAGEPSTHGFHYMAPPLEVNPDLPPSSPGDADISIEMGRPVDSGDTSEDTHMLTPVGDHDA